MTEMLKRLRDKKVPVAIYYKSVGGFCAGFVRETDDEFALLELISPSGRFDGYLCIRIEEILKLDAGTAYLNNLVKVYRHYGEEPLPIKVSSRDVLREFTDVVIKNKWMCTMEIGFETLDKINGFVVGREWESSKCGSSAKTERTTDIRRSISRKSSASASVRNTKSISIPFTG